MDDRPIGVFDSGFGGLTVARAMIDLLPGRGHRLRRPTPAATRTGRGRSTRSGTSPARSRPCWSATTTSRWSWSPATRPSAAALDLLRFEYDVPLVGVIDPGVRAAVRATRNRRVGVIGTVGTIGSGAYQRAVAGQPAGRCTWTCAACPGFVEFVERGETASEQVHVLAERLLAPVAEARVDTLLLGCTHYPFLARTIADVMGRDVVLVSSADETAFEVRAILAETGLGRRSAPPRGATAGSPRVTSRRSGSSAAASSGPRSTRSSRGMPAD